MTLNPVVSVEWLAKNLDIPNLVILDASPKVNKVGLVAEYPGLKIKDAIPFDMEASFLDKDNTIPNMFPSSAVFAEECEKLGITNKSVIVVYDNLGILTSPRAWWMFKSMGHEYVTVLDGGLNAWKEADLPCEQIGDKVEFNKGSFQANYNKDHIKNSTEVLEDIKNENILIIDARSEQRFSGSLPEPRKEMASGHIPNSKNLPFNLVLNKGKMKSKIELEKIFTSFNINKEELVFTCGSGVTACIILLASKLIMDNKKSLYDGSWAEWGQLNKFPVEV